MYSQRASLPVLKDVVTKRPQLTSPSARPKKLAVAGGGNDEWEEF
jgi:methyl-accepting chemotaxis protein/methyl-accepting chemotaxis protein-1 (serine sensor receptor)